MAKKLEIGGSGIGLFGLMFLLFLGLKLTGHIDWSWFWVTAPLWGGVAFIFVVAFIILLIGAVLS